MTYLGRWKKLIGVQNGINTEFITEEPYQAGTLLVTWDGLLASKTDSYFGWTELDNRAVKLNAAPNSDVVLACSYRRETD